MFITSAHQICIQTSNEAGRILIGVSSPAPVYMHSQFEISEREARDFAAALIVVADSAKQASAAPDAGGCCCWPASGQRHRQQPAGRCGLCGGL